MTDTAVLPAWELHWRGDTFRSVDLTGEHAAVIAELLGVDPSWAWFDVSELHPAFGPLHVMAFVAAFVIVANDVQGLAARQQVLAAIKGSSIEELLSAIET